MMIPAWLLYIVWCLLSIGVSIYILTSKPFKKTGLFIIPTIITCFIVTYIYIAGSETLKSYTGIFAESVVSLFKLWHILLIANIANLAFAIVCVFCPTYTGFVNEKVGPKLYVLSLLSALVLSTYNLCLVYT